MKKFLIGVLAMIPVIVVLALSATGSLIAMTTPVNPESVVVRSQNNTPIDGEVKVELNDEEQYILIDVLPAICYSKEIEYEYDEEYGNGKLDLVQEEGTNRYRIVPLQSGVARVIIRAKANYNAYAAVTFIIASEKIEDVTLYDGGGEALGQTLRVLGQTRLYAEVCPIDALSGSDVVWSSSAASVVEVTQNGVIRPVSRGHATITVSARDKLGTWHDAKVEIDTTSALVGATKGYCSEPATVGWVRQNLVLDPEAEVEQTGEGTFTVRRGSDSVAVEVERAQAGDMGFTDGLAVIYKNNGPSYAEVKDLLTGQDVNAVLVSSDPGVLNVIGNELVPIAAGRANVIASANGRTISKELMVKERPMTFDLNLTGADGKLGIGMTRVWGCEWFRLDEGSEVFTHEYPFGARGWNGENFDLSWSLDKPEYASVDQSGTITFSPEARGQSITVSACVMVDGRATDVKRSFTFNMAEEEGCVNLTDYDSLVSLTAVHPERIPVFQSNIDPHELIGNHAIGLYRGLYGNGFLLDYGNWKEATNWMTILEVIGDRSGSEIMTGCEQIKIVDLQIRGAMTYEDSKYNGHGIYITDVRTPVLMKNLVIYNCNDAIHLSNNMDITVEGCILGDSWYAQVNCGNNPALDVSEMKLNLINNVFKQSLGPAFLVASHRWNNETFGKNVIPTINVRGFLDVYNWKPPTAAKNILSELDPALFDVMADFIDPQTLLNAIGRIFEELMNADVYVRNMYVDKKGDKWLCMGGFLLGALMTVDTSLIHLEDERFVPLRLPLNPAEVGGAAAWIITPVEVVLQTQGYTCINDCWLISYDFNGRTPDILPGDPVPSNKALYERLNAGVQDETEQTEEEEDPNA